MTDLGVVRAWACALLVVASPGVRGDDLESLVARLGSADVQARWEAVRALAVIDRDIAPALPALAVALFDDDVLVRRAVVPVLGRIGQPALGWIAAAFGDGDPEVRAAAARVLGTLGHRGAAALPALVRALRDEDEGVREQAAQALGEIGVSAEAAALSAIATLDGFSVDPDERAALRASLSSAAERVAAIVRALTPIIDGDDTELGRRAAESVLRIAEWALARELAKLDEAAGIQRLSGAVSLLQVCSGAMQCSLLRYGHADEVTRRAISEALHALDGAMGGAGFGRRDPWLLDRDRVSVTKPGVAGEHQARVGDWLRHIATVAHARPAWQTMVAQRVGRTAAQGVLAAARAIRPEEWRGLVAHYPEVLDVAILPLFVAATRVDRVDARAIPDGHRGLCYMSAWSEKAMDALMERLGDRRDLALLVPSHGRFAHRLVPMWIRIAADSAADPSSRGIAIRALGDVSDERGIPTLTAALDDPLYTVRIAAVEAIASLRPPRFTTLVALLESPDLAMRTTVFVCMRARVGPTDRAIVPALLAIVAKRESPARGFAIHLVGKIGDASMVPALEHAVAEHTADVDLRQALGYARHAMRARKAEAPEWWEAGSPPK